MIFLPKICLFVLPTLSKNLNSLQLMMIQPNSMSVGSTVNHDTDSDKSKGPEPDSNHDGKPLLYLILQINMCFVHSEERISKTKIYLFGRTQLSWGYSAMHLFLVWRKHLNFSLHVYMHFLFSYFDRCLNNLMHDRIHISFKLY